jgi:translation initiation factor 3 subunit B
MKLLDNKAIRIEGVQDIAWSPSNSVLAYWVNERDNVPARIVLLELPSKKVLREKHLVNVADIKLHWSTDGDYLCVKLVKQLTKKKTSTNFEIFCMRKRDIPVEVTEVTDNISAFAWEPRGSRFAIIHNDGMHMNQSVSFYTLQKNKLKLVGTLRDRSCNTLFWSPAGNYIVLATLGGSQASGSNGGLEFFDVNNMETVATGDHFLCTDVEWDPSGRYVITAATQPIPAPGAPWKYQQESGYRVWSLQGTLLATCTQEHLYQANWRPRPPTLVDKKREEEIKTLLMAKDKVWKTFADEDEKLSRGHEADLKKERQKMKVEWRAYRAQCEVDYAETATDRAEVTTPLSALSLGIIHTEITHLCVYSYVVVW